MRIKTWLSLAALSLTCCASAIAGNSTPYGVSLTLPIVEKDPEHFHGYRVTAWYQPKSLIWEHVHIYINGGIGHWWVTGNRPNKSIMIYSLAPTLRYYFINSPTFSPYINISIGLSYLSKTRIDCRNLGIHYAFQDEIGIGATFGAKQQFSASLSALHYSNGSMAHRNSGITVPIVLNLEYGFG